MESLLKEINRKKRELDKYRPFPPETIIGLEEWLRIELTYSSNAIEGNSLSRLETAEVIEKGVSAAISGKSLKDQLEAINHDKALRFINNLGKKYQNHQAITERDIKTIHKIILTGINDQWAGKYRQIDVFIRGTDVEFPRPQAVPYQMKEFIDWLKSQKKDHPVRIAANAHFKLVSIHPFIDGNGRTSRLLMNLILIINSYPMAIVRNEERINYLQAVNRGQKENDLKALYFLIEKSVNRSLSAYLNAFKKKSPLAPLTEGIRKDKTQLLDSKNQTLFKIGELAKATGETNHTLRYWTKEGLLRVKKYTPGGYQLYQSSMIQQVKKIRYLQKKERLSISEIKKKLA